MALKCTARTAGVLLLCLLLSCLQTSMGIRIEISPSKYTEEQTGGVKIACILDSCDNCANRFIIMIKLTKDEETPMAFVRTQSGVNFGNDQPQKYEAQGAVDNHNDNPFLKVTILTPDNDDTGHYKCSVHYVNQAGVFMEDSDGKTLTVEIFNVHGSLKSMMAAVPLLRKELAAKGNELETLKQELGELDEKFQKKSGELDELDEKFQKKSGELDELKQRHQDESKRMAEKASLLEDEVATLKDQTKNQSHDITYVREQATYTTAFSAGLKASVDVPTGSVVVFDDIRFKDTDAYDESTGIFTVPRHGLYAFHLVLFTSCTNCGAWVHIKVNDTIMASVGLRGPSAWNGQSSVSCVRELSVGDKVRAVVYGGQTKLFGHSSEKLTLFTGYLVRAY